jgi:peptidoglycan/xylan/chitin deacetylase (PgdA/CDA1 family)
VLPTYYTRLKPFAAWFEGGWPILTYHKVGPRPWGTRLRGLYVSEALFRTQIKELKATGFTTRSLDQFPPPPLWLERSLTVTFDDGFENVFFHALPSLLLAAFRSTLFLVADRIGGCNDWEIAAGERPEPLMEEIQIRDWIGCGQEIGSHTCTHPWLTRIPLSQAREEIVSSKKKLEDRFSRPVRHFCYPYGDYNSAVAELVAEAGYVTACTTRAGLNTASTPPYEMLRITARYRPRTWRAINEWLGSSH